MCSYHLSAPVENPKYEDTELVSIRVSCFFGLKGHLLEKFSILTQYIRKEIAISSFYERPSYRGAGKSLARPGRKQATATKL